MHTLEFINNHKLSELDWNLLFLSGLPANIENQVHQCLLITKTTHHSSDPYPVDDTVDTAQFLLTGSALHPMLAAPTAAAVPAQPYYPAWAALLALPAIP